MKRAFTIFASCIALVACERGFDITGQMGDGTVWMTFIPSNDYDSTFFFLQATTPLEGATDPVMTTGESVEVRVNGQPLTLEKNKRSVPDRIQCYVTDHVFQIGDRVEASVTMPGVGTVSASCEVPEPFPEYTWKARFVESESRPSPADELYYVGPRARTGTLLVDVDYADPDDDGGYYGAVVIENTESDSQYGDFDQETGEIIWDDPSHDSYTEALQPTAMVSVGNFSSSEEPVTARPMYYNFLSEGHGRGRRVLIWKDTPGTAPAGGRRSITIPSFCSLYPSRYESPGEYPGGPGKYPYWWEHRYRYQLVLYRFSESYYNYLKAQYNSEHNDFSALGMAPASFVYTNVRGGAGVCGAYTVISSEWIELE